MDFFSHSNDLSLTNSWVKSILHLLLQLNFPFPKKNLSLSLYNLSQDISLWFLERSNAVLESNWLIFKLLQLLFELILNVKVIILEFLLKISVLVEQVIQLIHFKIKVILCNFKLPNLFLVRLNLGVNSQFLLLKDRLLGSKLFTHCGFPHVSVLFLNKISLVLDPLFLSLNNLILKLFSELDDVIFLGLHRSWVLIITTLFFKLCPNPIELVNSKLFFINNVMSLLNLLLKVIHFLFSVFKFSNKVIKLLL